MGSDLLCTSCDVLMAGNGLKLRANFRWGSSGGEFVTKRQLELYPAAIIHITALDAYHASTNKTEIGRIETELPFLPAADVPGVYMRALTLCCFCSLSYSTCRKFYGGG